MKCGEKKNVDEFEMKKGVAYLGGLGLCRSRERLVPHWH